MPVVKAHLRDAATRYLERYMRERDVSPLTLRDLSPEMKKEFRMQGRHRNAVARAGLLNGKATMFWINVSPQKGYAVVTLVVRHDGEPPSPRESFIIDAAGFHVYRRDGIELPAPVTVPPP